MKKLLLVFFLSLFLLLVPKANASSDFSTNYNVKYTVSENQNTHVQINITMSNKTDIYYASSYKIHIGFLNIKNVTANDGAGNILTDVEKKTDERIINVAFNEKITGVNNKLNFSISFDTTDVAKKLGNIWEVNIPGLASQSDISDFNVAVIVPQSFKAAAFIKPSIKNTVSGNSYSFTKNDLGSSGISMTFGNEQIYRLNLAYHLYNKNLFPVKTEIAIPPNTNYQEVEIDDISPKPINVSIDSDGNWLARYYLSPSQKKDIVVNAKIKVKLNPKTSPMTDGKLKDYLKGDKYWEVESKNIREKVSHFKTPYDVYNFVSTFLKYDYSRVTTDKPRLGATETFANPSSAVCLEFTDLFITLARAAGIPAREVDGFAYTDNPKERPLSLVKDILHAWPEYYDRQKNSWIMVDPTWANTTGGLDYFNTLDFDHIAFVIKGKDSTYPVPAGGYKLPGNESIKDVEVSFGDNFDSGNPTIRMIDNLPKDLIAGFPLRGAVTIRNSGKIISPPQKIIVRSQTLRPNIQSINLDQIPPYGNLIIPVSFEKTPFLTNTRDDIRIILGGNIFFHQVNITPIFLNKWSLIGGAVILAGIIIAISIVTIKPWNLSFFRRKEQNSLRREGEKS